MIGLRISYVLKTAAVPTIGAVVAQVDHHNGIGWLVASYVLHNILSYMQDREKGHT